MAFVGLMVTNLQLANQNRGLIADLNLARGGRELQVGDSLQRVVGVDLTGQLQERSLVGSGRHLLVLFSANCEFCLDSFEGYRALEAIAAADTEVVWLTRDDVPTVTEFFGQNPVTGNVLMSPSYGTYLTTGLAFVPQLVSVDPSGLVERVWHGAPSEAEWDSLRTFVANPSTLSGSVSAATGGASPDR